MGVRDELFTEGGSLVEYAHRGALCLQQHSKLGISPIYQPLHCLSQACYQDQARRSLRSDHVRMDLSRAVATNEFISFQHITQLPAFVTSPITNKLLSALSQQTCNLSWTPRLVCRSLLPHAAVVAPQAISSSGKHAGRFLAVT